MNQRQALKAANKHIEEQEKEIERLEDFNLKASAEIKALNICIDSVIAGEKTYCDWCEEENECQLEKGKGCSKWWMKVEPVLPEDGGADDSKIILSASPTC